jgi:superfamily II DNA or RNA helicase
MSNEAQSVQAGDLVSIRAERWRVVRRTAHEAVSVIEVVGCDLSNHNCHSRFLLPYERMDPVRPESRPRLVGVRRWSGVARHVLADASPWTSLWSATRADLRIEPFQLEPALALIRGDGCRFLIADAVGLGKTVQAGLMIAETLARRSEARVLVVAPAALREQWRHELQHRFAIDADVLDAAGIARLSSRVPASVNPWSVAARVVTSIDYVKRPEVLRSLEMLTWDLVVFDEAHNLAGPSDRSAAANAIGQRARVVVLLTATPHSGDDQAFERLCSIGRLDRLHPLLVFKRTRGEVGLAESRRETLLRVNPSGDESELLATLMAYARLVWNRSNAGSGARLAMSVLVRRACSSSASLARSIERRLELLREDRSVSNDQPRLPFLDLPHDEEPWLCLDAPGLSNRRDEHSRLSHILDLARRVGINNRKFSVLRKLIDKAGEPAIVFTEYRDTLGELPSVLPHLETVQLHGGLTAEARREVLARFTRGTARVLLATDAASEGLNLHQRCRLVINLELPWTPVRLEQRAGRVDRMGQTRRVHVVHLLGRDTCEDLTLARLTRRLERVRQAMGPGVALPDERAVAEAMFEGREVATEHTAPWIGRTDTSIVSLETEGCIEANRLTAARSLLSQRSRPVAEPRAVATRLRRRSGFTGSHGIWVFRITFSSASGQIIWEPVVALEAHLSQGLSSPRRDIRERLATDQPRLVYTLTGASDALLRGLRHSLRRPVAVSRQREEHLIGHLRRRRARLAADLIQRSLFDNRAERFAASQAAVLEQALARSRHRLQELDGLDSLEAEGWRLSFAAVID